MNRIALLYLLMFSQIGFSQEKKQLPFSIVPFFGLGFSNQPTTISSTGIYTSNFVAKPFVLGSLRSETGEDFIELLSTSQLGIRTEITPIKWFGLTAAVSRNSNLFASKLNLNYKFKEEPVGDFYDNFKYYTYSFGGKLNLGKFFVLGEYNLSPNVFNIEKDYTSNNVQNYVNDEGTGAKFTYSALSTSNSFISSGIGGNFRLLGNKTKIMLYVALSSTPIFNIRTDFFENRQFKGSKSADYNLSSIQLRLERPINFYYTKKTPKPKEIKPPKAKKEPKPEKIKEPKKVKEPKVKEPKQEKIKPIIPKKEVEIGNKKVIVGENLVLNSIQFEQSKDVLLTDAMKELDTVFEMLKKYPEAKIEIVGHTSKEGDRSENIDLSEKRARNCKKYLVNKGIKSNRVNAYGKGPDSPLSVTDQTINRRVEMKIISIE